MASGDMVGGWSRGFAYIALLAAMAIMSLFLAVAAEEQDHQMQREREVELLFVGEQFRAAIDSYYRQSPGGTAKFPTSLEELLLDRRFLARVRHLRRIYADPMTGNADWGLVRDAAGGIHGVFSQSPLSPIRTSKDLPVVTEAEGRTIATYADWKFVVTPDQEPEPLQSSGAGENDGQDSKPDTYE